MAGIYGLQESSVVVTEGKRFMIIHTIKNYEKKYNIDKKCRFDPNDCFDGDDGTGTAKNIFDKMDCACKTIAQEDFGRAANYAFLVVRECFKQREIYSVEAFKNDKFINELFGMYTSKYLLNKDKGKMSPKKFIDDIIIGSGREGDPCKNFTYGITYSI